MERENICQCPGDSSDHGWRFKSSEDDSGIDSWLGDEYRRRYGFDIVFRGAGGVDAADRSPARPHAVGRRRPLPDAAARYGLHAAEHVDVGVDDADVRLGRSAGGERRFAAGRATRRVRRRHRAGRWRRRGRRPLDRRLH